MRTGIQSVFEHRIDTRTRFTMGRSVLSPLFQEDPALAPVPLQCQHKPVVSYTCADSHVDQYQHSTSTETYWNTMEDGPNRSYLSVSCSKKKCCFGPVFSYIESRLPVRHDPRLHVLCLWLKVENLFSLEDYVHGISEFSVAWSCGLVAIAYFKMYFNLFGSLSDTRFLEN